MARIRTIKPEFVDSESVGKLSREARLLFILLWTFVDDSGRSRASSRLLASRLYPYDDDVLPLIDGWLAELVSKGHIRRYEVEGDAYLDIPKWLKHQKIDHPTKSRLPEFRETSRKVAKHTEEIAPHTLDLGPVPRTLDQGESASGDAPPPDTLEIPEFLKREKPDGARGSRLADNWQPSADDRSFAADLGIDPDTTAEVFRDYWHAQPGAKGRKTDWSATWRNWCRRDRGDGRRGGVETFEQRRIREGEEALRRA